MTDRYRNGEWRTSWLLTQCPTQLVPESDDVSESEGAGCLEGGKPGVVGASVT